MTGSQKFNMQLLVINLNRDSERWRLISNELSRHNSYNVLRVSAVYGPNLPAAVATIAADHLSGSLSRGTLGTFISHVKAWETFVALGIQNCIILEDDAVLIGFDRVSDVIIPEDADIIFLNDRMSPGSRFAPPVGVPRCMPINESLRALNRTGFGVGADGYFLTKQGAVSLLNAISKDLLFGHVDWRLLRYSLMPEDLSGDLENTRVAEIIPHHHNPQRPPAWGILKAYCLDLPLVAFATGGTSTREEADKL